MSGLEARGPKGLSKSPYPTQKTRRSLTEAAGLLRCCYETESFSGVNVRLNGSALSINCGIVARTPLPNC